MTHNLQIKQLVDGFMKRPAPYEDLIMPHIWERIQDERGAPHTATSFMRAVRAYLNEQYPDHGRAFQMREEAGDIAVMIGKMTPLT